MTRCPTRGVSSCAASRAPQSWLLPGAAVTMRITLLGYFSWPSAPPAPASRETTASAAATCGRDLPSSFILPPSSSVPGGCAPLRIRDPAVRARETVNALHLVVGQREVEDAQALGHVVRVGGAWNRRDVALLDEPAQRDLRHGLALAAGDLGERGVLEQ